MPDRPKGNMAILFGILPFISLVGIPVLGCFQPSVNPLQLYLIRIVSISPLAG
jgi:hypothetical protein